jgi:WD40 repeat protein
LPRVMVGRAPNAVVTWDLESGQEIGRHQVEGQPLVLKLSPNGDLFATAEASGRQWKVALYDVASGASRTNQLFAEWVTDLDWHPTGRWVGIPDHGGNVHLLDSQTGTIRLLGQHTVDAVVTAFSPDGRYLFSGGWDRRLICWDLNTMRRAFAIELDSYRIQFRADGRQCAIIRWPEVRVQLHAFERPALHRKFAEDLGGRRNFAAFSPDGRWLAASGAGEHVVVWNLDGTGPGAVVKKGDDVRVSFAPNGELFANRLGDAARWRLTKGTNGAVMMERRPLAKPSGLFSLCLVSNGVVFTSDKGSKLSAFDQLETPPAPWKATIGGWNGASPDGRWLGVYRPNNPHLYVYGLPGFERVAKLTNQARISQFEFSPRGDEVAVASRSGVEFWSTTTWQRTRHLTNFGGILYSPDARTLWLWTRPGKVSLHDARTAEALLPLPENTQPMAVSADGRRLAVAVDARRAQVWDLEEVRQRLRDLGLDWTEER